MRFGMRDCVRTIQQRLRIGMHLLPRFAVLATTSMAVNVDLTKSFSLAQLTVFITGHACKEAIQVNETAIQNHCQEERHSNQPEMRRPAVDILFFGIYAFPNGILNLQDRHGIDQKQTRPGTNQPSPPRPSRWCPDIHIDNGYQKCDIGYGNSHDVESIEQFADPATVALIMNKPREESRPARLLALIQLQLRHDMSRRKKCVLMRCYQNGVKGDQQRCQKPVASFEVDQCRSLW